ncbi:MAG: cobyric acid synthase [Pseudomonadota bacterium]
MSGAQKRARALMLQGVGSDVGKSLLTAAFCRLARRRGLSVAPFKPQNMSNNAAACPGGGEIGRAQALQAQAAGAPPEPDMNPILLKPETDRSAQLVVQGRARGAMAAQAFGSNRGPLLDAVMESFERLAAGRDLVLVEGAGSPAEINLRAHDIANMGFARRAGTPVVLIGDIDKGGVIASLVGTQAVLDPNDAAMIRGFLVNKFRGDPSLFEGGVAAIERRTGWPRLGVVPWLRAASLLPAEDAVALEAPRRAGRGAVKIAAPMLSRMANFDDADPLRLEPGVAFEWTPPGRPLPRDADVIILFGSKSTIGDLAFLRAQGWDHDIIAHARAGGRVLGICGGFQMLGARILDPRGADGAAGAVEGLGLLAVETVMAAEKRVAPVSARCAVSGAPITGYEIHLGRTVGAGAGAPFAWIGDAPDGARSADGRIEGTYLHGAFGGDAFRRIWLGRIGAKPAADFSYNAAVEMALDALADGVAAAVDVDAFLALAEPPGWAPR